ncbi:unnamed protein product [Urochloa humidicola]
MDAEALLAGEGGIGNRAADDADHGQVLRDRRRLAAAERELKAMALPIMSSAAIFMRALSQNARQPPAWVSEALEAGEPVLLRARLYGFLNTVAIMHAAAIATVLCAYLLGLARADHALASVRLLFLAVLAFATGVHSVGSTDSLGEAAVTFLFVMVTAAVLVLYAFGELKGFVLKIGRLLGA